MLQRIHALILKEFLAILRDPRARHILVVPPLIELLVFSFAATQEVKNVPIAVLNEDYGTAARDLIARFEGSRYFAEIHYLHGEPEIAPAVDSRSVLMVLHLGPDFSRRLEAGMPAEVQLVLDGRRSNAAQIVAGYAQAIFDAFDRELAATRRAPPPPSLVAARVWFNPNLETTWNTVPSLVAILTTLMGLVVTALSVARERELGTFEQLLVSPLEPIEIIIGKTVPALIIGLAAGTLMIAAGVLVFRIPFQGSFALLYLAMTVYLAAVIGVGLFISSLATTQQQGILGAFVFMVPAILLSGFATPI
jgi:ABC-2 type transport system permease protein